MICCGLNTGGKEAMEIPQLSLKIGFEVKMSNAMATGNQVDIKEVKSEAVVQKRSTWIPC
uniref:Uncharacterized protein n=1 Tax=Hyaloperonospora arabidopsidis (strain Emoy2) TaxID=559515 RepID=M4BWW2_HYAAE